MIRNDFAIMILSHGRANNVKTVELLNKSNYTGKWYIIIDNEDSQAEDYYKNFGRDRVIMFDKKEVGKTFDIMDNFKERNVVTFARNAVYKIANQLGLKYILEFEDDYTSLIARYVKDNGNFSGKSVLDFDAICNEYINYLEETGILTVAFAQMGDFIGGAGSRMWRSILVRKAMNSFFINLSKPLQFKGRFNDDVNMYMEQGKLGEVILTTRDIALNQLSTQENTGGITDAYLKYGTYVKSFYSVMMCPASVKIYAMIVQHSRIHHVIDWNTAVPKIISDKFKIK